MVESYQVGYKNMGNYHFGDFDPPDPPGGVKNTKKTPNFMIFRTFRFLEQKLSGWSFFFIAEMDAQIWYLTKKKYTVGRCRANAKRSHFFDEIFYEKMMHWYVGMAMAYPNCQIHPNLFFLALYILPLGSKIENFEKK